MTLQNQIGHVINLTYEQFLDIATRGLVKTTIYKLMEAGKAFGNMVAKQFGRSSSTYSR